MGNSPIRKHTKVLCLAAGLSLGFLAACQGGNGGLNSGNQAQTPQDNQGSNSATPTTTEVQVGIQPVADTPVATLFAHEGHGPLKTQVAPSTAPTIPTVFTKQWVVSPDGNDNAAGTEADPFKTINRGIEAVGPGEVLRVKGGTYAEEVVLDGKSGTAGSPITVQGEGSPKIVPSGSKSWAPVMFKQPNWILDGFEIDGQGKPVWGVSFEGNVKGSTLANSDVHSGTAGAGVNLHNGSTGSVIENNHIHDFKRTDQDSHGIVVQTTTHNTTIRQNDINDVTGDTIQCLGPEGYSHNPPADGLLIEANHLFNSEENAVDIKTCQNVTVRNNRMDGFRMAPANQGAKGEAVIIHLSAKNVVVEGNEIYDAGRGISLGGNRVGPKPTGVVIRKNTIHDIKTDGGMEGSGMRIENSTGAQVLNNTFYNLAGPGLMLGHGTGGSTENLVLKNNTVAGQPSVNLGTEAPGLNMDFNVFSSGAEFQVGNQLKSLSEWKALGHDPHSKEGDGVGTDSGAEVGLPFCGSAPDVGAMENC